MQALRKTFVVEAKLFLREPAAVFFTLLLPLLLLVLNTGRPEAAAGGPSVADVLVPGYVAMVMATAGIMALPETIATYRERGVLRRMRLTPLASWKVLAAHGGVQLVVTTVGLVVLILAATVVADMALPAAWLRLAATTLLAMASVLTTGFLLASLLPTARTTRAVAAALYFPMIFLSGAVAPRDQLPELARTIGDVVPLTYAVSALRDAWIGASVNVTDLAVLAGVTVASIAICTRTFRWE